ncbi:hypothetical protein ACFLYL_01695, partial [Chloroflexota bacterium]
AKLAATFCYELRFHPNTNSEGVLRLIMLATTVKILTTSQSLGKSSATAIALCVSLEDLLAILKASPFMKSLSRYIIY